MAKAVLNEDFDDSDDDLHVFEEDPPQYDDGFDNIIVVDNVPVVAQEKFQKLEKHLGRVFRLFDDHFNVIKNDGFWMPVDPVTQKTLGYCFIKYNTRQAAKIARVRMDRFQLDRNHAFAVNKFNEFQFDRLTKVLNEWACPESMPYTPWENLQHWLTYQRIKNFEHWLTDGKARDQFVIWAGSDTECFWNDTRQLKPVLVCKRANWTESFVQWSPLGTYLATVHRQGVVVWGGASFSRLMRYAHPQVKRIDFSPSEKYLVTHSRQLPSDPCDNHKHLVNVFDVRTGNVMWHFEASVDKVSVGGAGDASGVSRPSFMWGGGKEDKYFAMIQKNVVSIYETETFSLIDKKPLEVENVMDFSWSPVDSILALFVPEVGGGSQPARVSLVQVPSKKELRHMNLCGVTDCKMYWQSNGDYLAATVNQCNKNEKIAYTGFALFRIRERDIPIDILELENKDEIIAFEWEPKGHKFAVIHGDSRMPDVSFYSMHSGSNAGQMSKLTTLKGKQANALFWSPDGHHIIISGLERFKGNLEFYNVDKLETMATNGHFKATGLEWDPTGRYIATLVTPVDGMETGFKIWSFTGKLLYQMLKYDLFQFSWRPRPPFILSHEKEEAISKNLTKYSKKYEADDKDACLLFSEKDCEKRRKSKDDREEWLKDWKREHEEERVERERERLRLRLRLRGEG